MAKDNIIGDSLITLSKTGNSNITKEIIGDSNITKEIIGDSFIGIEDEAPVYPPVLEDGNGKFWGIASDLSRITKDASDFTSSFRDQLDSGRDLLQAFGAAQPLWMIEGLLFNGLTHFMKTLPFTWNQPEMIYMVVKQVTWTLNDTIFDGNSDNKGFLRQRTITPGLSAYAGTFSPVNANLPINTFGIIRLSFNGVNSSLQINETTPVVGDFGSLNMGGFTLGRWGFSGFYSNILVPEIIARGINETSQSKQDIYNYLNDKYPIGL